MTAASFISSDHVIAFCALAAFLLAVYGQGKSWSRKRRVTKDVLAGKNKTALESLAEGVQTANSNVAEIMVILKGPERKWSDMTDPPIGLVRTVQQHGEMLTKLGKLLPNGGNTDDPGDLQLKMARKMGVTEQQGGGHDG